MDFAIPDDLATWKEEVRRFVAAELTNHDGAIEESGEIPPGALDGMRNLGLFGTHTPKRYGGLGHTMLGNALTIEELAKAHIAYFYTSSMNVHIASKGIELDGSEAQRLKWLPELTSGRLMGAYALTEAEAGSDAAGLRAQAARDGGQWVLNGAKRYITNAPIADLFTLFVRTGTDQGPGGISAFIVEAGTPGLEIGQRFAMAGGRGAHHAEVILEDCRVPAGNLIGAEGAGFATAMKCLDAGRLNWAAYSVGAAEGLLEIATGHLLTRHQFGKPLADNQGLQWRLADMATELHSARLVAREGAWRYDREPERRPRIGAMAKLAASERVSRLADETVQLLGGAGNAKDLPVERIWREVRAIRILEGTSEMMRHIVAKHLLRDARAANHQGENHDIH